MGDAFFEAGRPPAGVTQPGTWFQPTVFSRGPWDPDACHAGPPTAALAWGVEQVVPTHRLVRLTVDLIRPVPLAGFFVQAQPVRVGRAVASSRARIVDAAGRECASVTAAHTAEVDGAGSPRAGQIEPLAPLAQSVPGPFPVRRPNPTTGFLDAVQVRYPPGEDDGLGPTALWMRTVEVFTDRPSSPFQRLCALADCTNALSRYAEPDETRFLNSDLSVFVHRPPTGEWFGSRARSVWQPSGIGVANAVLFDVDGPVGWATQTLLLR